MAGCRFRVWLWQSYSGADEPLLLGSVSAWWIEQIAAQPGATSGVACTVSVRVFVSVPQYDQPAPMPTVAELVDSTARPLDPHIAQVLTSVQFIHDTSPEMSGLWAGPTGASSRTGKGTSGRARTSIARRTAAPAFWKSAMRSLSSTSGAITAAMNIVASQICRMAKYQYVAGE